MNSALLLMDYQVGLCRETGSVGGPAGLAAEVVRRDVLTHAARCLGAARDAGMPVIHVRVAFDQAYRNRTNRSAGFGEFEANKLLKVGDVETEICEEVAPQRDEVVLDKGCVDPFIGTPLEPILHAAGVRTVYLGGVATNFVVESAARYAGDSGFEVIVLEDLCASFSDELHQTAIAGTLPLFAMVSSSDEFIAKLEAQ